MLFSTYVGQKINMFPWSSGQGNGLVLYKSLQAWIRIPVKTMLRIKTKSVVFEHNFKTCKLYAQSNNRNCMVNKHIHNGPLFLHMLTPGTCELKV